MFKYVMYELTTGRFIGIGTVQHAIFAPEPDEGCELLEAPALEMGELDLKYYNLTTEQIEDRPSLNVVISKNTILADDSDSTTLSGLPDPCTVNINGVDYEIEEGQLILTADVPSVYKIKIDHWPYFPWEGTIEATEE